MYRRVLLAFDGTSEGGKALREGALLATRCRAEVFLLSVVPNFTGVAVAEGAHPGALSRHHEAYQAVFDNGMARLRQLGLSPAGELISGEPAEQIGAFARRIRADLVVVGHRKRGLIERWWSGSQGAYLMDNIDCSLLVGRLNVADEAFEKELNRARDA